MDVVGAFRDSHYVTKWHDHIRIAKIAQRLISFTWSVRKLPPKVVKSSIARLSTQQLLNDEADPSNRKKLGIDGFLIMPKSSRRR